VEIEGVRNRKGVRQPVGDLPGAGLDAPTDVRFRPRVQERVDDPAARERGIEERTVRMPTLRAEGRIHEDGLEGLADGSDIREAPLDVDARAFRVPPCDFDRRRIRVQTHHPTGAEKLRGDREHAVPAPEVRRRPALDVAPRRSEVRDLGGDAGGRRILLGVCRRVGQRVQGLQDLLESDLLRRLTPSRNSFLVPGRLSLGRRGPARGDHRGEVGGAVPEQGHEALALEAAELALEIVEVHTSEDLEELALLQPD
jgi:hypothetical protein